MHNSTNTCRSTMCVLAHAWAGAIKSCTTSTLSCILSSTCCPRDSHWQQHDEHQSIHCSRLSEWGKQTAGVHLLLPVLPRLLYDTA